MPTLRIRERALHRLPGIDFECGRTRPKTRGARRSARAIVAGDAGEIESRSRITFRGGVSTRLDVVHDDLAAIGDRPGRITCEREAARCGIRIRLLLDDDLAALRVRESAGDYFASRKINRAWIIRRITFARGTRCRSHIV